MNVLSQQLLRTLPCRAGILCGVCVAAVSLALGSERVPRYDQPERVVVWNLPEGHAFLSTDMVSDQIWIRSDSTQSREALLSAGSDLDAVRNAMNNSDGLLCVWRWENDTLTEVFRTSITGMSINFSLVPGHRYVHQTKQENLRLWQCVMRNAITGDIQHSWPEKKDWENQIGRASANGRFVAIVSFPEIGGPEHDWDHPKCRVGLIDVNTGKVGWVMTVTGCDGRAIDAIPSNDGRFIAIPKGFCRTCIGMMDVAKKRLLWPDLPNGSPTQSDACCLCGDICITCRAACFSPDTKTLFLGRMACRVDALDVRTGNVVARWYATDTGREHQGYGCPGVSAIRVSPDGQYVAVRSDTGHVFVRSEQTGNVTKLLHPEGATGLLAFSSGSRYLATSSCGSRGIASPGSFKIWSCETWDNESK